MFETLLKSITNSRDLFFLLYTTPFFLEASIFLISLNYLIFCCLSKQSWWRVNIIFTVTGKIFYFFIFLSIYSAVTLMLPMFDQTLSFNGRLVTDFVSVFTKTLIVLSATFSFYWYRHFLMQNFSKWDSIVEIPLIFIGATLFLLIGVTSYDVGIAALCIIAMSICLYAMLIANSVFGRIYREAAIKYFLMSALSGGLILGGAKEIFALFGTLSFWGINTSFLTHLANDNALFIITFKTSLVLIFFGFLFKISAAPSHFWAPEVYEGTPLALVTFLLLPIKIAAGVILLRLFKAVFYVFGYDPWTNDVLSRDLEIIISFVVIASMLLGAVNSVFEQKIKRFIAYSSINQIGFLVVGLLGPATTIAGAQAFIYFLVTYVLNMLVFFSILLCLLNFLGTVQVSSGRQAKIPLFFISDLRRFDFSNGIGGLIAVALVIVVFSLIGIPPLAGFFGKFYLLFYAFSIKSWTVLILGIITSIISAYYYLRILRASFFEEKLRSPKNDSPKFSAFICFYWFTLCVISLSFFYFDSNIANLCYENALSLYCLLW